MQQQHLSTRRPCGLSAGSKDDATTRYYVRDCSRRAGQDPGAAVCPRCINGSCQVSSGPVGHVPGPVAFRMSALWRGPLCPAARQSGKGLVLIGGREGRYQPRCTPSSRYWRPLAPWPASRLCPASLPRGRSARRVPRATVSRCSSPAHRARSNVEMLTIFSDVQTPDSRCADWAQLIHDDRVPLLPARRQPGPRRPLTISDLIGARHRPSPYRCSHRT
jgi:hypothetical protein